MAKSAQVTPLSNKMPCKPSGHDASTTQMDASITKQLSKQIIAITQIIPSVTTKFPSLTANTVSILLTNADS
jgi:hypothetical protein